MKKIFIFFYTAVLIFSSYSQDKKNTYFVKPYDTLPSIAGYCYSKLPNSEKNYIDNSLRWILIFNENKNRYNLEITFFDYSAYPIVFINENTELIIPVLEKNYPKKNELNRMIDREYKTAKQRIKSKNKAVELQNQARLFNLEINELMLSMDMIRSLNVESITYENSAYTLTDETILPSLSETGQDIFIWKIIEHPKAKKTVIVFPDSHGDYLVGYDRFLAMKAIKEVNKKSFAVLLEAADNFVHKDVIEKFYKLRKIKTTYDFNKILTTPHAYYRDTKELRSAMISSMALFYIFNDIKLSGIEDIDKLNNYLKQEENFQDMLDAEAKKKSGNILNEFSRKFSEELEKFKTNIESDISASSLRINLKNMNDIYQLNKLKENFVKFTKKENFSDTVIAKYDDRNIENTLSSIDKLASSNTLNIYKSFKETVSLIRKKLVSPEGEEKIKKIYREVFKDLKDSLLADRDEVILNYISNLPDNSISFLEIGTGHINNLVKKALDQKLYNMVIYHHPAFNYFMYGNYAELQNPKEHEEQFKRYQINPDYTKDLIMSAESKNKYFKNNEVKLIIESDFLMLKQRDFTKYDKYLERGTANVFILRIKETGYILRVSRLDNNWAINAKYYFTPGKSLFEISEGINFIIKKEPLASEDKRILEKFIEIRKTFENL